MRLLLAAQPYRHRTLGIFFFSREPNPWRTARFGGVDMMTLHGLFFHFGLFVLLRSIGGWVRDGRVGKGEANDRRGSVSAIDNTKLAVAGGSEICSGEHATAGTGRKSGLAK